MTHTPRAHHHGTTYRWRTAACAAFSLFAGVAFAQETSGGWIDSAQQSKTIYPMLGEQARQRSMPPQMQAGREQVDADTKVIWPKSLNSSEMTAVARGLLPQAFQESVPQPTATDGARRVTPLMLKTLVQAAARFNVDAYLIKAVIHAESAFNPRARSPKNAIGLMQVLPGTARDLGLTAQPMASVEQLLTDPRVSIVVGTKYLAEQIERFSGNAELAVAAYNAGPGAVTKAGNKVPNYPETRTYVKRVLKLRDMYRARRSLEGVQL